MNILFDISGGLGKSIMGTAVLKAMRKQYKKANIIVISSYPEVFINNPYLNKVITHQNAFGINKEYIDKKDCKVFVTDPYTTSDFICEKKHLIQIWCEMFGIKYNGELPEFFLSKPEKQYFEQFYRIDKPIFVIQPHGGAFNQPLKYSWTRDIPQPITQKIINHMAQTHAVIQIRREDQLQYENCLSALDNYRSIAVLLTLSDKRLFIDSFGMHLATALKLPSVVTWVGTNPEVFGYDMHKNIVAFDFEKEFDSNHPNYTKIGLFEDISKFPYFDLENVFDADQIIKTIME